MKSYLVQDTDGMKIMQVRAELEPEFLKAYAGRIITEGGSIQEMLTRFSELLK